MSHAQEDLWSELHDLFDTDDGSLPEVALVGLPRTALQPLFELLRTRGAIGSGTLWDPERQVDLDVADVPDAGERVASGRLPSFHVVFTGIRVGDVTLPRIGAFFWPDEVALDYRMGAGWSPSRLGGFARLLGEMRALAVGVELQARPDGGGPEHADPRFERAIDAYLARSSGIIRGR